MNSCPTVNTYRSGVITFGVIGNAAYIVGVLSQGSCDQVRKLTQVSFFLLTERDFEIHDNKTKFAILL